MRCFRDLGAARPPGDRQRLWRLHQEVFEDTKSFVEKLSGVKSLDKAMEAQTDFARSAYETFVAESQKIAGLYSDLAKQAFKPVETVVSKFTPAAQ